MEKTTKDLTERLQIALEAGNLAWWEMELPSGSVSFDENKTKMLGYKKEDFKHYQDFVNLVHPEDQGPTMQAMRDHLSGVAKFYETDYRIKTNDGTYKWFRDKGRITQKEGDIIKVAGIVEDISIQKEALEKISQKNTELEKLNTYMMDRELKMIELKKEIEDLKGRLIKN